MRAVDDPVIKAIAKQAPVKLRIRVRDQDEPQMLPVHDNARRWTIVKETLETLEWDRIECLDKDGKLLGPVIANAQEDDGLYDDDEDASDPHGVADAMRGVLRDAMRVNLQIMQTTMKETRQIFDAQTKSQSELVGVMVEGLRAVQDSYQIAMRVQTAQMVSGGEGGNTEMMDMMKMAMMVGMQGKGAPPAPAPRPPINIPQRPVQPAGEKKQ